MNILFGASTNGDQDLNFGKVDKIQKQIYQVGFLQQATLLNLAKILIREYILYPCLATMLLRIFWDMAS